MSTPKRLHEEGSHSSPLKRQREGTGNFSGVSGKVPTPVGNDFRLPIEAGQDGSHEIDKRPPLLHRIISSPSDCLDYPITSEKRSKLRNPKDASDVKVDNQERRSEMRELHSSKRMDPPVSRAGNGVRADNWGDEKELRSDNGSYIDFKGNAKFESDTYATVGSHENCRESKEHHMGKRHSEPSMDNLHAVHIARHGLQSTVEVARSRAEERDSSEAHVAAWENKIDIKGEEKIREDRKRKEEKYSDLRECYKNINDQHNNMQIMDAHSKLKEESESWERERKEPNLEPRFCSKAQEYEESQEKHEVLTIVYKAGECMQELLKSWKEFEASQEGITDEMCQNYLTLEIRIRAEYVTSSNRRVRDAHLWGTDVYTNDSDLFAVLMHTGYCRPTSSPPDSIQELRAIIRVLPPQEHYVSTLRNNIRSRAWGAGIGCSFRVERCCIMKKSGGVIDLEPRLTHISAFQPTLAPVSVERTITTRSASLNALQQHRFVQEVAVQYNLCNEPWLRYSISILADRGLKKPLYTSARLKQGEVIYLESHLERYELCYNGEKSVNIGTEVASAQASELVRKHQHHSSHVQNGDRNLAERENAVDVFRLSRCKKILPEDIMLSTGIPLRVEDLEIIEDNLEWEDLQWSQTGILVAGKTYSLARVHFLASKKK